MNLPVFKLQYAQKDFIFTGTLHMFRIYKLLFEIHHTRV